MRRTVALLLVLLTLRASIPATPASASAQIGAAPATPATPAGEGTLEALTRLLDARDLKQTRNPVVASFLAGEGAALVPEEVRERALQQLRGALKSQTNVMGLMLAGVSGILGSDSMKKQQEWAQKQSMGKLMAGAYLGIAPVTPSAPSGDQMQREMQAAMTDPWVRGIEAAAALELLGDPNAAARFYVQCLAFLPQDWVPEACLQRILGLGPDRAGTLLTWMLAEAESITETPMGGADGLGGGIPSFDPDQAGKKAKPGDPQPGTIQVRNAALAGLGFLLGGGGLTAEKSSAAFAAAPRLQPGQGERALLSRRRGRTRPLARSARRRAAAPARQGTPGPRHQADGPAGARRRLRRRSGQEAAAAGARRLRPGRTAARRPGALRDRRRRGVRLGGRRHHPAPLDRHQEAGHPRPRGARSGRARGREVARRAHPRPRRGTRQRLAHRLERGGAPRARRSLPAPESGGCARQGGLAARSRAASARSGGRSRRFCRQRPASC